MGSLLSNQGSVFSAVLYLAVAVIVLCEGLWFFHRFRTRKRVQPVLTDEEKRFSLLWAVVPPLILVFLFLKGVP